MPIWVMGGTNVGLFTEPPVLEGVDVGDMWLG
jgi:hypothetical protein